VTGGVAAIAFVAWWCHPRRRARATWWVALGTCGACFAVIGLVYARYVDRAARLEPLPAELSHALGMNASHVMAFYGYDLGGFIDHEWLWRIDVPRRSSVGNSPRTAGGLTGRITSCSTIRDRSARLSGSRAISDASHHRSGERPPRSRSTHRSREECEVWRTMIRTTGRMRGCCSPSYRRIREGTQRWSGSLLPGTRSSTPSSRLTNWRAG
jgi:hypothetical protein